MPRFRISTATYEPVMAAQGLPPHECPLAEPGTPRPRPLRDAPQVLAGIKGFGRRDAQRQIDANCHIAQRNGIIMEVGML